MAISDWLGGWPWAPNGFVSRQDEQAQQRALHNPARVTDHYAALIAYSGLDRADESFGGFAFAYVPTEQQIGAAIAVQNWQAGIDTPDPHELAQPTIAQLVQSMYDSYNQVWQELAAAQAAGWSNS